MPTSAKNMHRRATSAAIKPVVNKSPIESSEGKVEVKFDPETPPHEEFKDFYPLHVSKVAPPKTVNPILATIAIIFVLGAAAGAGWYVVKQQESADTSESLLASSKITPTRPPLDDETADWSVYTNSTLGLSFKYPTKWFIKEDSALSRIYIRNFEGEFTKDTAPDTFQQMWFSYGENEANVAQESDLAAGKSSSVGVVGEVTKSIISNDSLSINSYSYTTAGGVGFSAYFADNNGKRYTSTIATELDTANNNVQAEEATLLKKILSTVSFSATNQ